MNGLIPISYLNDFLFCPYSIYLHQVYRGTEEETVKALPQKSGTSAHARMEKRKEEEPDVLLSLPVLSEDLGLWGVIDEYNSVAEELTEYKNKLTAVFPGQKMQAYAQYFCMMESGYPVKTIRLVELVSGNVFPISIPGKEELHGLEMLIARIRDWNPDEIVMVNTNKCRKCIYCPLCEKTNQENVF